MNLVLISYGDYDYDGRLRELYDVCGALGRTVAVTRGSSSQDADHMVVNLSYPGFIIKTIAILRNYDAVDALVLDNRRSIIPGVICAKIIKPKCIILDRRELYIRKEVKHLVGKIGCLIESFGMKRADIVLCANRERADLVQKEYSLANPPIVFENIRQLHFSSDDAEEKCKLKYSGIIEKDEIRIISTAGCSLSRRTDKLVEAIESLEFTCRLLLVGGGDAADKSAIRKMISDHRLSNVELLGKLNQDELKYLIGQSHVGIVSYHQNDTNNRLCASGKAYEYLYEGIPIVTTENPPLRALCDRAKVGIADDGYSHGIINVISNYELYKANVRRFIKANTVEKNRDNVRRELLKAINSVLSSKG